MEEFVELEFQRDGFGLAPDAADADPGLAIYVPARPGRVAIRTCSCAGARQRNCRHQRELARLVRRFEAATGNESWRHLFEGSLWYRLADCLFGGEPEAAATIQVAAMPTGFRVFDSTGLELLRWSAAGECGTRLLERLGQRPPAGGGVERGALLERLFRCQLSDTEAFLRKRGMLTIGQKLEESFWFRVAYHCFREFGRGGGSFHPAIEETSGEFMLAFRPMSDGEPLRIFVARSRVRAVLELLREEFPDQEDLAIHPVPLRALFHISPATELDVEVRPILQSLQAAGESRFLEGEDLERFRYGKLVWVKELRVLAELEDPERPRRFRAPQRMRLRRHQVPGFLDELRGESGAAALIAGASSGSLTVFERFDSIEIVPETLDRSWYWLSVRYGFGEERIPLAELLAARKRGDPYLETRAGWVDLRARAFDRLEKLAAAPGFRIEGDRVRLGAATVLGLCATEPSPVEIAGDRAELVDRLLRLRPASPLGDIRGLASALRDYQRRGVDWLRFLFENGLSGLLCDEMGLGKTHQAMALLLSLCEQDRIGGPFLVVTPRTVMSHWQRKVAEHAPGLSVSVYHGADRSLAPPLAAGQVVLTSYGILRRDAGELSACEFAVVVLDEIQHAKNRDTLNFQAAAALHARMKVGLTGTPVENDLGELGALFDLVLPGYFAAAGVTAAELTSPDGDVARVRRVAAPFVLRRSKSAVLEELPEKIEDTLACTLSEEQVALYRQAITSKGEPLRRALLSSTGPPPYLHIFALLNFLKQICDHPALALGRPDRFAEHESGKWDAFLEILGETLDGGQKVVVFSQYLGMLEIMRRHLDGLGVGFAVLTGSTRNRAGAIDRFNVDPRCRVFLGSLKAGGTGIDLVAGSAVIHYDRWWNAAREDQATDRVHRIGQKRAVQVFRLVTEGTLEEKISAIIEKKRRLAASAVADDDARLARAFTREELLALLSLPTSQQES
jgi:superfamily II DNA or RNA helicase